MKGLVKAINPQRGLVGAKTDLGHYSIFELIPVDAVAIGDEVRWTGDTPMGNEHLFNDSRKTKVTAYFQNHHVTEDQLREQLQFDS